MNTRRLVINLVSKVFLASLFSISVFLLIAPARSVAIQNPEAVVNVDARMVFQTIQGFGTSSRVFDDPHVFNNFDPSTNRAATVLTRAQQDEIYRALYTDLGLTRVIPLFEANVEPVDGGGFIWDWKRNDAHLDYVKRAEAFGLQTYIPNSAVFEVWMNSNTPPARIAEWYLARLRHLRELDREPAYFFLINEPGWGSNSWVSPTLLLNIIRNLGPRMRAEGFQTLLVVPNNLNASMGESYLNTILSDASVRPYIGAIACHLYQESNANVAKMNAISQAYNIPLWMTEYSLVDLINDGKGSGPFDWALTVHEMLSDYNCAAVDFLWGGFGDWVGRDHQLVVLKTANNAMQYAGYELTKQYYLTGQYSRYVKPGAKRIRTDSQDSQVKVTAFKNGEKNIAIVAINTTGADKAIRFNLAGIAGVSEVQQVRTSDTENWTTLQPIPVNSFSFVTTMPRRSIATFIMSVAATSTPRITEASISGKKLFILGENFDNGAVILINGKVQKSANDSLSPTSRLIGKKAGKWIPHGETVTLEVRNSIGTYSDEYRFMRQ